ncbi:MAG: PIN domain-containing protein [Blastocatellia bacterium]
MKYYTYDTSTIISRKLSDFSGNFLFSSAVLLELMASADDEKRRKYYEQLFHDYWQDNSLIVPTEEDWLMASKVLFWLDQGRRRNAKGLAPRLKPGASQRMAMDALIAASAKHWDVTLITENWDDFKAIQRYCKVTLVKASDFFGS